MADLATSILNAYRQREDDVLSQPGKQLAQVGALQGILASAQKQQNEQAGILAQQQFRAGIRPDMSHEQLLQHAIGSGLVGPKDLATILQGEQNKKITAAATAEQARLRLSQQADQFSQTQALKYSQLDLAEKSGADKTAIAQARLALDTQDKAFKQQISQESLRLTGEAGNYNFGSARPNIPGVTIGAPAAGGAAPTAPAGVLQTQRVGQVPPADEALVRQLEAQQRAGQPVRAEGALQGVLAGAGGGAGSPAQTPLAGILAAAQQEPEVSAGPVSTAPPSNADARDLRYGSMAPQPSAAPAVTPAAAPVAAAPVKTAPVMPPFTSGRARDAWLAAQARQGAAGPGRTDDAVRNEAWAQIYNGKATPGAMSIGVSGNADRDRVANEKDKIAKELGMSPQDLALKGPENRAKFVALAAVEKDLAAITPYKEMLDTNAKVAIELGRKIADDKTNSAFINKPLLWLKNNASNRPDVAEYLAQMHFVETEAARVLSNPRLVGQMPESAVKDMKSVVSGNMTVESGERVLNRIMADGENRTKALHTQRERTMSEIRGTPSRTRASDKTGVDADNPLLK